jgi:hypothetical protein
MRKIWCRLAFAAFAAIIGEPALAQDHQKNFVECTKEFGLQLDPNAQKLQDGRTLRTWYLHSETQEPAFSDCVARKANRPGKPSAKGLSRGSR